MTLLDQASVALGVNSWGKGVQSFGLGEVDDLRNLVDPEYGWFEETPTGKQRLKKLGVKERLTPFYGPDGMSYYMARDVAYTHLLYEWQRVRLLEQPGTTKLMRRLILPGVGSFLRVELNGLYLDQVRMADHDRTLAARAVELSAGLWRDHVSDELAAWWEEREWRAQRGHKKLEYVPGPKRRLPSGDPWHNNTFIKGWLYGKAPVGLGLKTVAFTKTGEPKVDEPTLRLYVHPSLEAFGELKKALKGREFFQQWRDWLGADGRIHASFNLTGTITGRRSNDHPNLQQVPRDTFIRTCFGAPPGYLFLECDYSQLEVRLAAWLAGEETMLRIFAEGGDIYRSTAAGLLNKRPEDITSDERRRAKAYVLGFLYGMGAGGFVRYAKATYDLEFTLEEAQVVRDVYFSLYPGLVRWHEEQRRKARRDHQVTSPTGRIRHLINIMSWKGYERGKAERQAINAPVQGLGADFTLASIIELLQVLDPDEARPVGDVHDAVLFEIREDVWEKCVKTILRVMERPKLMRELAGQWPVRVKAEAQLGSHWKLGQTLELSADGESLVDPVTLQPFKMAA
jgi:DNA polymerase I-like protein with 3'-5' exonuclease and polymerase domains